MSLLRLVLSALCSFSDSCEITRLKKKLARTAETLESSESDCVAAKAEANDLWSTLTRERAISDGRFSVLSEAKDSMDTEIRSLREDNKKLEETLAEAKSQLALNALEKELMSDLFEKLRQKVRADIASVSDSYANIRPEQFADGFQATGRSSGPGI